MFKYLLSDRSLRSDFSWVLAGNVLYSACQWGVMMVLAKLGTPVAVGEYALGMAVAAPVILFANFQLRALLASDVREEFSFGEYIGFRILTLLAAVFVVAGLSINSADNVHGRIVVVLVGIAVMLDYFSDAYYGFMQKHDHIEYMSRSLMIKGPLSLAFLACAMYFTREVVWAVVALIAGRLAVLILWDIPRALPQRRCGWEAPVWNIRRMYSLFKLALPLGIISMLLSLNSNLPRYFLKAHLGTAELGIYSAIASLLTIGSMLVSAYGQSIFVPVARAVADRDGRKYLGCIAVAIGSGLALGGALTLGSALWGKTILAHLFRSEYADQANVLTRLMMAGTVWFVGNGLGFIMTASRSVRIQIPLLVMTLITTAACSALFIPLEGVLGAADAMCFAAVIQVLGTSVVLMKVYRRIQRESESLETPESDAVIQNIEVGM